MSQSTPVRVIVIDDDEDIFNVMSALLQSLGCEIVGEAVDGVKGLALFKRTQPDLVFLDVQMPELDGLSTLKEILKFDSKAQVIMLTALENDLLADDAHLSGARGYIRKDTELHILSARITEEVAQIKH